MDDRIERSVGLGAERHPLDGRGPVTEAVHLLAGQHHPHRALQLQRALHRQHHLVLWAQAGTERTADERRHDAHIVGAEAEHAAHIALHVLHALRLVEDRELAVAVPNHRRGKQLHRIVMLGRDEILGLVTHGGSGIGFRRVTTRLLGLFDHVGLVETRMQIGFVAFRLVFDAHQRGREARGLPVVGDHQGDRLAVELDGSVVERTKR